MNCTAPAAAVVLASEMPPVAAVLVVAEAHPAANSAAADAAMANADARFLRITSSSPRLASAQGAAAKKAAAGLDHRAFALIVSLSTDHATDQHQLAAAGCHPSSVGGIPPEPLDLLARQHQSPAMGGGRRGCISVVHRTV